tara:strand:- start:109 stop:270 length:162 start_codon:yes stop_codon:yes gene_type:complete
MEERLVRVDDEERELDKQSADLMLLATTTLSFGSNSNNVKERGKVEEAPFNVS